MEQAQQQALEAAKSLLAAAGLRPEHLYAYDMHSVNAENAAQANADEPPEDGEEGQSANSLTFYELQDNEGIFAIAENIEHAYVELYGTEGACTE